MLLTSSDTKRTLMHLFLFTKPAQRELAINFPCITPLVSLKFKIRFANLNPKFLYIIADLFNFFSRWIKLCERLDNCLKLLPNTSLKYVSGDRNLELPKTWIQNLYNCVFCTIFLKIFFLVLFVSSVIKDSIMNLFNLHCVFTSISTPLDGRLF